MNDLPAPLARRRSGWHLINAMSVSAIVAFSFTGMLLSSTAVAQSKAPTNTDLQLSPPPGKNNETALPPGVPSGSTVEVPVRDPLEIRRDDITSRETALQVRNAPASPELVAQLNQLKAREPTPEMKQWLAQALSYFAEQLEGSPELRLILPSDAVVWVRMVDVVIDSYATKKREPSDPRAEIVTLPAQSSYVLQLASLPSVAEALVWLKDDGLAFMPEDALKPFDERMTVRPLPSAAAIFQGNSQ